MTASKIVELLKQTDPKVYTAMVLGVAQAETSRASNEVDRLESMLHAARSRYFAAVEAEKAAGEDYDAAHKIDPFRETFPEGRPNGRHFDDHINV